MLNSVEPMGYKPPTSGSELLDRYAAGERHFWRTDLTTLDRLAPVLNVQPAYGVLRNNILIRRRVQSWTFPLVDVNLVDADFSFSSFAGAELIGANLTSATFFDADLRDIQCSIQMHPALYGNGPYDLNHSTFIKADFTGANLSNAELWDADLSGATFIGTDLSHANLGGVKFECAVFGWTMLYNVTLDHPSLAGASHNGPSFVDLSTLKNTAAAVRQTPELLPILDAFFSDCGLSKRDIGYFHSMINEPDEYYSCFISHSSTDKPFARHLFDVLRGRGIRCWIDERSMTIGDDLHASIDHGVRAQDKLILVCSEQSLRRSWWVDNEITTALEKEQKFMKERGEKLTVLLPVDLDGFLFSNDAPAKAATIRSRIVGDFRAWQSNSEKFSREVDRLVDALRIRHGQHPQLGP